MGEAKLEEALKPFQQAEAAPTIANIRETGKPSD
jgi:hypothetical protein